jgi:hypothetical protein
MPWSVREDLCLLVAAAGLESLEMVQRYTRPIYFNDFNDSLKFYKAPLS